MTPVHHYEVISRRHQPGRACPPGGRRDQCTSAGTAAWNRVRRSGFTLVEVLIVVVILGILATIVVPQFTSASDVARDATAGQITRIVQEQIALYRVKHGAFPTTIDNNWFTPPGLPVNPYLPEGVELVVQNIAGKTELDYKHSNKGAIIWWYNRATGTFHTRVPWQGSDAATLALYNQVNHCTAVNP